MFGVAAFVPALKEYVDAYGIETNFGSVLTSIDGPGRKATFREKDADGAEREIVRDFDMIHVCPPQIAADVVRGSPLADANGWIDVDQETMRHKKYANVFGVGDAINAPNSKTAAAARKQAPIAAANLLPSWTAARRTMSMTVTPPARSPSRAARSSSPNSAMAGNCCRHFRNGSTTTPGRHGSAG